MFRSLPPIKHGRPQPLALMPIYSFGAIHRCDLLTEFDKRHEGRGNFGLGIRASFQRSNNSFAEISSVFGPDLSQLVILRTLYC